MSYDYVDERLMDERLRKQINEMLDSLTVRDLLTLMKVISIVVERVTTYANEMAQLTEEDMESIRDLTEKLKKRRKAKETESAKEKEKS